MSIASSNYTTKNLETRRIWRAINCSQGKTYGQGISKVEVNVDGEWTTVTDRKEVEPAIMTNNSKRFNLTLPTPMMSEHAVNKIGYLAENKYASDVIKKTSMCTILS